MLSNKWAIWLQTKLEPFYSRLPGLLVSVTIALAASFLSQHFGGPLMLYALLLGIAFNFLCDDKRCVPGIEIAAKTVLRLGVALLGARITINQMIELGVGPAVIMTVITSVLLTIAVGWLISRMLKESFEIGLLTGGAVAICGASAALALSAVMPKSMRSENNTIVTVVGVTTLSTIAMVIYPLLVEIFEFDATTAGIFLGSTIHDVAQVIGAGYMISAQTGDISTFIKLLRVAMLVPVVCVFSVVFRRVNDNADGKQPPILPLFLVAFIILVICNSSGLIPASIVTELTDISRWCLVIAISALGIKTSFKKLITVGWMPILMIVGETVFLAAIVLGALLSGLVL